MHLSMDCPGDADGGTIANLTLLSLSFFFFFSFLTVNVYGAAYILCG